MKRSIAMVMLAVLMVMASLEGCKLDRMTRLFFAVDVSETVRTGAPPVSVQM